MKKIILFIVIVFMAILLFYAFRGPTPGSAAGGGAKEGFESTAADAYMKPAVLAPYSSKSIYNVYDTIYYDKNNGNVIVLNDASGGSSTINILNRTNSSPATVSTYPARDASNNLIARDTTESVITTLSSAATEPWTYNTASYEITYIPFDKDTYIHVMDITTSSPSLIMSACFTDPAAAAGGIQDFYLWTADGSASTVGKSLGATSGTYAGAITTEDGASTTEPYYDTSAAVYQISQYVKYDTANGNLLVQSTDASGNKVITVYERDGAVVAYTSTNNATTLGGKTPSSQIATLYTNFQKPIFAVDSVQTNLIVYWPYMDKTVIAEYQSTLDSGANSVTLVTTFRAVGTNVFAGSLTPAAAAAAPASAGSGSCPFAGGDISGNMPPMDKSLANYFMWFYYWNKMGAGSGGTTTDYANSDKYIAKTQIVPPVCPAQNCPACNCGTSTCSTCKSGAASTASTPAAPAPAPAPASSSGTSDGGVISDSIRGTGSLVSDTVRGTGSLVSDTVRGTGSFAKDAVTGTAKFGKEAVVETAETVKSGAEYVGKGIGGFLGKLTSSNPTQVGSSGAGGYNSIPGSVPAGAAGAPGTYRADPYSYGGGYNSQYGSAGAAARPDPLPVLADFSRFGR